MKVDSLFNAEIKSLLYGEDFKDASHQKIITAVQEYSSDEISKFWEILRKIKTDLRSNNSFLNFSYFVFPAFENTQLTGIGFPKKARKAFNFWEKDEEVIFNDAVSFYKANFVGVVHFQSCIFKESMDFSKTIVRGNINFSQTRFKKNTDFRGTQFKQESKFEHSYFEDTVSFEEVRFQGRTLFQETVFSKKSSFRSSNSKYRISFYSCTAQTISFNYSRIENAYFIKNSFQYLNLHGVAIENPFFSDNIIKEAGRETYAYLKHFFDRKKDYISANNYYAKEMSAYQKELFPKSKVNFFKKLYYWFNQPNLGDKLVFGFAKLASNFGQNIFLPIYWILFAGALFVGLQGEKSQQFILYSLSLLLILSIISYLFRKFFHKQKREDIMLPLAKATLSLLTVGLSLYQGAFISNFTKVVNPIQMLKGINTDCQGIEFSCLLLRVFIATMVYHFVITSKRGVKR